MENNGRKCTGPLAQAGLWGEEGEQGEVPAGVGIPWELVVLQLAVAGGVETEGKRETPFASSYPVHSAE